MGHYFAAVWRCRYFWLSLVKMDLRTRYRRSILGVGWSLLNPLAMTAILCLVFPSILKVSVVEYGLYVLTNLACWNYLRSVTLQGCQCLFQAEAYIRQHPAPLAIYPLRTALGETFHFLMALLVVMGLSWLLKGFDNTPALATLVPAVLLLFVFGWAMALLAGFANVHFQDTQHLAEIGFQILFYATPIMWKPEMLGDNPLATVLRYNPIVGLLRLVRDPIEQGVMPSAKAFGVAVALTLVAVGLASVVLNRLQRKLIFHL